jgi:hypothetical protein
MKIKTKIQKIEIFEKILESTSEYARIYANGTLDEISEAYDKHAQLIKSLLKLD